MYPFLGGGFEVRAFLPVSEASEHERWIHHDSSHRPVPRGVRRALSMENVRFAVDGSSSASRVSCKDSGHVVNRALGVAQQA